MLVLGLLGAIAAPVESQAGNDPTRPPSQVALQISEIKHTTPVLSSIILSESRQVAILGGRPLGIGQSLDGYVVVQIAPMSVRLRNGAGDIVTLSMRSKKISKDLK